MERKNSVIMKKILLLASLLGILSACGPTYIKPEDASQTSFDVAFFKSVNATVSKNENVIVSPYSAGVVFSMLAEGAEGQTKVEFDNALGGACLTNREAAEYTRTERDKGREERGVAHSSHAVHYNLLWRGVGGVCDNALDRL